MEIMLFFYLRNKRGLTVRLANGESQWPAAVLDGNIIEFFKRKIINNDDNYKHLILLDVAPEIEYC